MTGPDGMSNERQAEYLAAGDFPDARYGRIKLEADLKDLITFVKQGDEREIMMQARWIANHIGSDYIEDVLDRE